MNFTASRYAIFFLNSEIYIVQVIDHEWNRSLFVASAMCFVWGTKPDLTNNWYQSQVFISWLYSMWLNFRIKVKLVYRSKYKYLEIDFALMWNEFFFIWNSVFKRIYIGPRLHIVVLKDSFESLIYNNDWRSFGYIDWSFYKLLDNLHNAVQ